MGSLGRNRVRDLQTPLPPPFSPKTARAPMDTSLLAKWALPWLNKVIYLLAICCQYTNGSLNENAASRLRKAIKKASCCFGGRTRAQGVLNVIGNSI